MTKKKHNLTKIERNFRIHITLDKKGRKKNNLTKIERNFGIHITFDKKKGKKKPL